MDLTIKGTNFSLIKRRNKVVKLKYQRVVNYSANTTCRHFFRPLTCGFHGDICTFILP